jgi:hypothetical protein
LSPTVTVPTSCRICRPGPYRLQVELTGVPHLRADGHRAASCAERVINASLGVGDLAETVSVEAATPLIDVRTSGISEVVENERIVELPLQGGM